MAKWSMSAKTNGDWDCHVEAFTETTPIGFLFTPSKCQYSFDSSSNQRLHPPCPNWGQVFVAKNHTLSPGNMCVSVMTVARWKGPTNPTTFHFCHTPLKFNSSPLKMSLPKRKGLSTFPIIFQGQTRCETSGEVSFDRRFSSKPWDPHLTTYQYAGSDQHVQVSNIFDASPTCIILSSYRCVCIIERTVIPLVPGSTSRKHWPRISKLNFLI